MSESPKRLSQRAEEEFRRAVEGLSPEDRHLMIKCLMTRCMRFVIAGRIQDMLSAVIKRNDNGVDQLGFDNAAKDIILEILRDVPGLWGMEGKVLDCSIKSNRLLIDAEADIMKKMSPAAREKIELILKKTRGKKTNEGKKRRYSGKGGSSKIN